MAVNSSNAVANAETSSSTPGCPSTGLVPTAIVILMLITFSAGFNLDQLPMSSFFISKPGAAHAPIETHSIAKNSKSFLMFELILFILVIDISLANRGKNHSFSSLSSTLKGVHKFLGFLEFLFIYAAIGRIPFIAQCPIILNFGGKFRKNN